MASRHRRQPSRALPLDFSVVDILGDDDPAAAASKHAASLAGGRSDVAGAAKAAGQEGHGKKKLPPPGSARTSVPEGTGKTSCDGNGTGR
ncbi:unnamed protein product [Alopecurus aequalis]